MSGELIKVGQLEIRYLVDGAKKGGLGVFEMTVPAGGHRSSATQPHRQRGVRLRPGRHAALFRRRGIARPRAGRLDVDAAGLDTSLHQQDRCRGARAGHHDAGHRAAVLPRCRGPGGRGWTARSDETHGSHDPETAGARRAEAGAERRADALMSALLIAPDLEARRHSARRFATNPARRCCRAAGLRPRPVAGVTPTALPCGA